MLPGHLLAGYYPGDLTKEAGDGIPFDEGLVAAIVAATEGVVLGPVEEGLVQVVGPDTVARVLFLPDQGATVGNVGLGYTPVSPP